MDDKKEEMITVCDSCFTESCWKGEFYCDDYKTAGTTQISKKELNLIKWL